MATLAATYIFIRLAITNRLKLQTVSDKSWRIIFSALIGARVVALINNFNIYFQDFTVESFYRLFAIWDRGLSIWGAIIGLLLYFYFRISKEENNFMKWLDVLTPSMIIGLTITHIGAFFDGINYGHETSLPWGVNFENPAIKYAVPIHPTQIYAFLYSITITAILIHLQRTHKFSSKPGVLGLIGISSYSFLFFLEEFFRGDDVWMIGTVRINQISAAIIFLISAIFLYKRAKK